MKKLLTFALAIAMAFSFAACSGTASSTAASTAASAASSEAAAPAGTDSVKLGFLAPTLQTEFFIGIDDGLKTGCADKGWEYTAVSFENDSSTAVTQIENLVTSGCNVILAMVSDTSCDDALAAAQEQGVKIVECGVKTAVYDVCLNTDQYMIGTEISEMAGEWINTELDGKANIVVYTTYQNTDMQSRGEGIQDKIKELCPDAKIVEVVDIGKDVVGAGTTTTETMLQKYPDLNCIISYGDASATESVEAAKAAGVDASTFGIFSCDGTEAALNYIKAGELQRGTVVFDPIADSVIEYAQRVLDGETFSDVIAFSTQQATAANINDFVS